MSKVTSIKTFDDIVDDDVESPDATSVALLELAAAINALAVRPEPVFPKTDLTPLIKLVEALTSPEDTPTPKKKKWEFDVQTNTLTGNISKIIATEK